MIVRPKYTFLKDGKQILRITVFGFPANYIKMRRGTTTTSLSESASVWISTSTDNPSSIERINPLTFRT